MKQVLDINNLYKIFRKLLRKYKVNMKDIAIAIEVKYAFYECPTSTEVRIYCCTENKEIYESHTAENSREALKEWEKYLDRESRKIKPEKSIIRHKKVSTKQNF